MVIVLAAHIISVRRTLLRLLLSYYYIKYLQVGDRGVP